MKNLPFIQKLYGVVKCYLLIALVSNVAKANAQLTCTKLKIDSVVVKINDKSVRLKHVQGDTFRAYVETWNGHNTFLFNLKSKQICSPIVNYKRDFLGGFDQVSSFSMEPNSTKMRPELNYVCRGVYEGPYSIADKENGTYKNEKLDGLIEVLKPGGGYWYGTTTYKSGQKHGIELCTNGRYTNRNTFENGKRVRLQVSNAQGLLLRDETFSPARRLITYDNNGNLTRLQVQDSIHLYYKRNTLRYSLTYNAEKSIWEAQSFYPSGKVERYCPHKYYKHSPIQEAVWYSEDGKVMEEPEPEIMVDEMMEYQMVRTHSSKPSIRVYNDGDFLAIDSLTVLKRLDSLLSLDNVMSIKKRNTGKYSFAIETNKWSSTTINFMYDVRDPYVSTHVTNTLESKLIEDLPFKLLTNYQITYFRGSVEFEVKKP